MLIKLVQYLYHENVNNAKINFMFSTLNCEKMNFVHSVKILKIDKPVDEKQDATSYLAKV